MAASELNRLPDFSQWWTPERLAEIDRVWSECQEKPWTARLIDALCSLTGSRSILEFGCGTGWIPHYLPDGYCYEGVDAYAGCVARAQAKADGRSGRAFRVGDVRTVTARPADVVVALSFLKHFHLSEWDLVLRRVLAHGAYAVLQVTFAAEDREDVMESDYQFPHVWVTEARFRRVAAEAGHEVVSILGGEPEEDEAFVITRRYSTMRASELIRTGYVLLPKLLSPWQARRLREEVTADLDRDGWRKQEGGVAHTLGLDVQKPGAAAAMAAVVGQARAQLGLADLHSYGGVIINKQPGEPERGLHQDWWGWDAAYSRDETPPQVGLYVALTDMDERNGCLRFVPESHRYWHPFHYQAHQLPVPETVVDRESVPVELQAGDVIAFDARCLHESGPNTTAEQRTGVTFWALTCPEGTTPPPLNYDWTKWLP